MVYNTSESQVYMWTACIFQCVYISHQWDSCKMPGYLITLITVWMYFNGHVTCKGYIVTAAAVKLKFKAWFAVET